ncbi:hypothetical protein [Nitrosopumilus ureiphilus]|uniref:hypothetical protein n=1 Tax=Nitrosopumilus ureiphilus TaxID=1470067 RepID=UPI0015C907AA|nr:hypothetical protein [Nitrosopumilus ureiphilus]
MKFFPSKVRYSILAGLAAYGTYKLVFDIIGIGSTLQNCPLSSEGTITVICYIFGLS